MILRLSKTLLVAAVALYYTLVVSHLTDYGSDYACAPCAADDFHVRATNGMARDHPLWITRSFSASFIAWEAVTMLLTWAWNRGFCARGQAGHGVSRRKTWPLRG